MLITRLDVVLEIEMHCTDNAENATSSEHDSCNAQGSGVSSGRETLQRLKKGLVLVLLS